MTATETVEFVEVGAFYCDVHHGLMNEDEDVCDFAADDPELIDDEDSPDFGEPRPCTRLQLGYQRADGKGIERG
jgi:hypothetical protein